MSDKQPVQASGGDQPQRNDGVSEPAPGGRSGGGESGGGAYPNPHSGKDEHPGDGFMGHGGQTDIGYHGGGQLGDEQVDEEANPNAGTRDD
jgi:hypothetical protein